VFAAGRRLWMGGGCGRGILVAAWALVSQGATGIAENEVVVARLYSLSHCVSGREVRLKRAEEVAEGEVFAAKAWKSKAGRARQMPTAMRCRDARAG
jgi:hypothetical protein